MHGTTDEVVEIVGRLVLTEFASHCWLLCAAPGVNFRVDECLANYRPVESRPTCKSPPFPLVRQSRKIMETGS
jgi:hypothetical protein